MQKVLFSSDALPAPLGDSARFSAWRDLYTARYGLLDFSRPDDRPFSARFQFAQFGCVGIGQFDGTMQRVGRSAREVKADGNDGFCLVLNRGHSRMSALHAGREISLPAGAATLFDNSEPGELRGESTNAWYSVVLPRRPVVQHADAIERHVGLSLQPGGAAMRHLRRYLGILDDEASGALGTHIESALLDLIVLALVAREEAAQPEARGVRAARLQLILAEIESGFADPAFSVNRVANNLGLSPRYIRDLLHETDTSFTEHTLELRLRRARVFLAHRQYDHLKIIDIALRCGFNEVSYFNRCFRRRFGASPSELRGANSAGRIARE